MTRGKEWLHLRNEIIGERGRRCERCGKLVQRGELLILHHIDGNPINNLKDNLALLCDSCHDWVSGRKFRICRRCLGVFTEEEGNYCLWCGAKWNGINPFRRLGIVLPLPKEVWSVPLNSVLAKIKARGRGNSNG